MHSWIMSQQTILGLKKKHVKFFINYNGHDSHEWRETHTADAWMIWIFLLLLKGVSFGPMIFTWKQRCQNKNHKKWTWSILASKYNIKTHIKNA